MSISSVQAGSPRTRRVTRFSIATLGTLGLLAGSVAVATSAAPAEAAVTFPTTYLSTANSTWTYSDNNTDPAAGNADRLVWTKPAFDDGAWKSAKGAFGAKNGTKSIGAGLTINTLLNQYANGTSTPDVKTYHFRSDFTVSSEQLAALGSLDGTITYDDAVQIFVNGKQVAGFVDDLVKAAPEAEKNLMYAGASGGDPVTSTFTVPSSALTAGPNTIAIALYQDREKSSDIYLDVPRLAPVLPTAPVPPKEGATLGDIVMNIGTDETSRRLAWYSDIDTTQVAQFAPKSAMSGTTFPAAAATTATATGGRTTSDEFNRHAEFTGLAENTSYVYRVGSQADGWSSTYEFRTRDFDGDYNFFFVGDPQIGASGSVANDQAGWADTLKVAQQTYPDAEMLFSAGDQVEHAGNEAEYQAFLAPDAVRELPVVPVNGNHDVGSKAYEQHYNEPNVDYNYGAGTAVSSGGDYWFMYKDVLYMVLNSNNRDNASHKAFLEKVVAEQGAKAKWKVLAFHHSIYSVASHVDDTDIIARRAELPTTISALGIDLVLMGHDHNYTRTYLIKDGVVANPDEAAAQGTVEAKDGEVLYVTANSASGSKYYNTNETFPHPWASVINQERVRNYSNIQVTDDAITVTTLRSQQNGTASPVNSVVDKVTLERADVTPPVLTAPAASSIQTGSTFDPATGVTATDDKDGDLTSAVTVAGTVDTATEGTYTLTYSVTDAAGNTTTATRQVTVADGAFTQRGLPTITGDARVGETLTASAGEWTPAPTGVAYQWLRAGQPIDGATSATYTPVAADSASALSVRVTVSAANYADAVASSAAVAVAPAAEPTPAPTPAPTTAPTAAPTTAPTAQPTGAPAADPTASPLPGASNGALPSTGSETAAGLSLLAVLLLVAGGSFVALRRTRRHS
jgi:LPXTG-motif cell wall-anchored protein